MAIRFFCPTGHKLVVPADRAGKKGRCPFCHQKLYVPVRDPQRSRKSRADDVVKVKYTEFAAPPAARKEGELADALADALGLDAPAPGEQPASDAKPENNAPAADANGSPDVNRSSGVKELPSAPSDLSAAEDAAIEAVLPQRPPTTPVHYSPEQDLPPGFDQDLADEYLPKQAPAAPPERLASPKTLEARRELFEELNVEPSPVARPKREPPPPPPTPYGVGPLPAPRQDDDFEPMLEDILDSALASARSPGRAPAQGSNSSRPPEMLRIRNDRWFQPVPSEDVVATMRPEPILMHGLCWLAAGLAFFGATAMLTAFAQTSGDSVPLWAQCTVALGAAQLACGAWLFTFQDWRTLRFAALLALVSAVVYAVGVGIVISKRGQADLPLDLASVRRVAGAWCAAHVFLLGGMAHGCRHLSSAWRAQLAKNLQLGS